MSSIEYVGKDKYGKYIPDGFGSLSYTIPPHSGVKAKLRVYSFWPTKISQTHGINGSKSQSHTWQHFYAKNYAAGQLLVEGRVRYQEQYDQLAQFIRDHQMMMVTQIGASNTSDTTDLSLMNLNIPSENLSWAGWVKSFQGGAQRFNVAPVVQLTFDVVNDRHSTNEYIVPSAALKSVFTGAFLTGPLSQKQAGEEIDAQQQTAIQSALKAISNFSQ